MYFRCAHYERCLARRPAKAMDLLLGLAGLFVALSAFVMLYQSYQARGYLRFPGQQAKRGC